MTLLAFSVLLKGAYTDAGKALPSQYQHTGTQESLSLLGEVAKETGATPSQVVYAWMIGEGIVPIIGVSDIWQLDEAMDAVEVELSTAQRERLDVARAWQPDPA